MLLASLLAPATRTFLQHQSARSLLSRSTMENTHKCSACQRGDLPLKFCSGCSKAGYCSRECQRAHWKEHKTHCNFKSTKSTTNMTASASAPQPLATTLMHPANDFIWFVEVLQMPIRNMSLQGPFSRKAAALAAIHVELEAKNPGPEGCAKFDAMCKERAFYDVNAEPERFEAPLPGEVNATIAFQLVRHVNKAVKESKGIQEFTVVGADFSMHFDEGIGKRVITADTLKAVQAFTNQGDSEFYLNKHTYELREPDMTVGVTNVDGDIVSMCYNDNKIIILFVLISVMGHVMKAVDLSLQGPAFQRLFFQMGGCNKLVLTG